ncbi:MAG: Trm112 family protein [Propionibacteriaceae bacterium]|jgi:uncharacterized protein YbaR (Trm112 family)|nr:Trm112 family protein [Propionibacteriaceae bacterium]
MTALPADILEILVCPVCHAPFALDVEAGELVCTNGECALAYPVKEGIPVLIESQARKTS